MLKALYNFSLCIKWFLTHTQQLRWMYNEITFWKQARYIKYLLSFYHLPRIVLPLYVFLWKSYCFLYIIKSAVMWSLYIVQLLYNCIGGYNQQKYRKLVEGQWGGVKLYFLLRLWHKLTKAREFTAGWCHKVPYVLKNN
jgi:hypothetical protein